MDVIMVVVYMCVCVWGEETGTVPGFLQTSIEICMYHSIMHHGY